ncbi:hypothetical protein HYALB_00002566 [Hymenoscyphus albidus]|uniref:Uncharacterized protein n=1 Tax=Hymenoscyphus albidus TaxID=595503 RepID=A0A9N9LVE0_9HELO|nr:hypothetical protein HYALB_00002566 [Hymenoscyphus albidus]
MGGLGERERPLECRDMAEGEREEGKEEREERCIVLVLSQRLAGAVLGRRLGEWGHQGRSESCYMYSKVPAAMMLVWRVAGDHTEAREAPTPRLGGPEAREELLATYSVPLC